MKCRTYFVSNSSSSSFVIYKKHLTKEQIDKIRNHKDVADDNEWSIDENNTAICGYTWMDNFDMGTYLMEIGVNMENVVFSDGPLCKLPPESETIEQHKSLDVKFEERVCPTCHANFGLISYIQHAVYCPYCSAVL